MLPKSEHRPDDLRLKDLLLYEKARLKDSFVRVSKAFVICMNVKSNCVAQVL